MSIFNIHICLAHNFSFLEKRLVLKNQGMCGPKIRNILADSTDTKWGSLANTQEQDKNISKECKVNIENFKERFTSAKLKKLKINSIQSGLDAYKKIALDSSANSFTKTLILQAIFHQTNAGKKIAKEYSFGTPDGYFGPKTKKMWNYINSRNNSIPDGLRFDGTNHDAIYQAVEKAVQADIKAVGKKSAEPAKKEALVKSEKIVKLQELLKTTSAKATVGIADGFSGANTIKAVKRFFKNNETFTGKNTTAVNGLLKNIKDGISDEEAVEITELVKKAINFYETKTPKPKPTET